MLANRYYCTKTYKEKLREQRVALTIMYIGTTWCWRRPSLYLSPSRMTRRVLKDPAMAPCTSTIPSFSLSLSLIFSLIRIGLRLGISSCLYFTLSVHYLCNLPCPPYPSSYLFPLCARFEGGPSRNTWAGVLDWSLVLLCCSLDLPLSFLLSLHLWPLVSYVWIDHSSSQILKITFFG